MNRNEIIERSKKIVEIQRITDMDNVLVDKNRLMKQQQINRQKRMDKILLDSQMIHSQFGKMKQVKKVKRHRYLTCIPKQYDDFDQELDMGFLGKIDENIFIQSRPRYL